MIEHNEATKKLIEKIDSVLSKRHETTMTEFYSRPENDRRRKDRRVVVEDNNNES